MDIRILGRTDYRATVQAMQDFTAERTDSTPDICAPISRVSISRGRRPTSTFGPGCAPICSCPI